MLDTLQKPSIATYAIKARMEQACPPTTTIDDVLQRIYVLAHPIDELYNLNGDELTKRAFIFAADLSGELYDAFFA